MFGLNPYTTAAVSNSVQMDKDMSPVLPWNSKYDWYNYSTNIFVAGASGAAANKLFPKVVPVKGAGFGHNADMSAASGVINLAGGIISGKTVSTMTSAGKDDSNKPTEKNQYIFMQKLRRNVGWLLFIIIIMTLAYLITEKNRLKYKDDIMKFPGYSNGVFKGLKYEKGKPVLGVYSFKVNGAIIDGAKGDARVRKVWRYLLDKSFPVIYSLKDSTKNEILVFPSDFSDFRIKYPDSLKWVMEILK